MSELERKLLARCLDSGSIKEAWEMGVRGQVFEEPLYEAIWNFTIDYWRHSGQTNAPTSWVLAQEFAGYEPVIGVTEETEYLADRLISRYLSNGVQEALRKGAKTSVIDPRLAAQELHADTYALIEVATPRNTRVNMADNVEDRWEYYQKKDSHPQGLGVSYGLDLMDIYTGGILPGELAVVAAFAKTGKTMFLLNAAVQALHKGYRPIVYTLELSLADTQERLDAMFSGVSYNRLSHGHMTEDEKITLRQSMDNLAELGGLMVERPEADDRTISYLCSRARDQGADYLIIDQLSKLEAGHKTYSKKEKYASILEQLKNDIGRAGRELPCLMAVQLRRGDDEPTEESFADAAEIERDVDIAFALHRSQDMRANHAMNLDLLVSRRTDLHRWILEWELSEYTRIAHSKT